MMINRPFAAAGKRFGREEVLKRGCEDTLAVVAGQDHRLRSFHSDLLFMNSVHSSDQGARN